MVYRRGSSAFTLVEIMIVVLIMAILMAVAVPQFVRSRGQAQQKSCVANLRQIDAAKEAYAYEHNLGQGATLDPVLTWQEYGKGPFPTCPGGGTYTVGTVGEVPTCSLANIVPHHRLP